MCLNRLCSWLLVLKGNQNNQLTIAWSRTGLKGFSAIFCYTVAVPYNTSDHWHKNSPDWSLYIWSSSFFFCLPLSDRAKFLAFSKKKTNDVVTPFFTWNNSFNLKNQHGNSKEKNRNKNMNIFHSILSLLLIQICECRLTFNVVLGYQGLLFQDFLWFFFRFFVFSIRPTDPISGNAFDSKQRKKRGLPNQMLFLPFVSHLRTRPHQLAWVTPIRLHYVIVKIPWKHHVVWI